MAFLINFSDKVGTDIISGNIMSNRKTQRFQGSKLGDTRVSEQSSNSHIVYGRRLALNPNAVRAAVLVLGLVVVTTPSWGHPGAPIATLAMGQVDSKDARRQAEQYSVALASR